MIKNIGDEVLFVADDVADAAEAALLMTARGADEDDDFPAVRAGIAYGDVVSRLGDVFGPTVNIAVAADLGRPARLGARRRRRARRARPRTRRTTFRRMRRTSVKGYSQLQPWVLRRARPAAEGP